VVRYPFALPVPTQLEGQEAIQKYFAAVAKMPLKLQMRNMVVHETSDPEVVVAEWNYDGLVTTTGRAFRV
jgi:ketosteroid isomerase-like protein